MKVSIITIVFNNREHIASCIESVLAQSYPEIEHVIIDGLSNDGTQQVIEKYQDRLGYYISEKDTGLYNALNKGIRAASGDIIGILHSDDLLFNRETISQIVEAFQTTQSNMVYANGMYVERNNLNNVKRIYPAKSFKSQYLKHGWVPLHTTIYVRKELFDLYGFYDESYRIASDYEITLRWLSSPGVKSYFLDQFVVIMRLGGKSTTMSLQKRKSMEDFSIIKKYHLYGPFTLAMKIGRKIPQFIKARIPYKEALRNVITMYQDNCVEVPSHDILEMEKQKQEEHLQIEKKHLERILR